MEDLELLMDSVEAKPSQGFGSAPVRCLAAAALSFVFAIFASVMDEELPKAAVQEAKVEDFTQQTKSSSERFERYRQSLGARHGPLFRRFAALLNGERGTSGSAQSTASPGLLTATVSAMVQLADLRLQGDEAGLVTAALELFEVLCSAVQELPQDLPPEAFMDGLRQRWRLGESSSEVQHRARAYRRDPA
eukprot:Skav219083  [mRNA]  locus=scaffold3000:4549:14924:- [translate_table: standard]